MNAGTANADWFGWNRPVLAPVEGTILEVHINDTVNQPGVMRPGRASTIVIARADGLRVVVAHVQAIRVRPGDRVAAGEEIARVAITAIPATRISTSAPTATEWPCRCSSTRRCR